MTAGTEDLVIEQGTEFLLPLVYTDSNGTPVDLTGWTAAMMIRRNIEDAVPLVSLSSNSQGIVLGGASGSITITIDEATTSQLAGGAAYYDLKLIDSLGKPDRLIQGKVIISPAVTR
jgi:hypothetical protein